MQQERKILVKLSIEKSENALKNAEASIEAGFLDGAQNRIYYSIFYSTLALGYLEGLVTAKHRELKGWFNRTYVHEKKIFDKKLAKTYGKLFDRRQKFDYDVSQKPNLENCLADLQEAKAFVDIVNSYVLSRLGE